MNPDTVTIEVTQAGDYYIDYYVLVEFSPNTPVVAVMGIFVNRNEVNPIQTRYAASDTEADRSRTNFWRNNYIYPCHWNCPIKECTGNLFQYL